LAGFDIEIKVEELHMAPSQLKQLKASLRQQGRIGPTPSKKQKKEQQEIRRKAKFAQTKDLQSRHVKYEFINGAEQNVSEKSGLAKERREQARKEAILQDMQQRHKVGGIVDRRFGEDDPTMTPEERAMERFVREKQRSGKKGGVFDLEEDDDDDGEGLTHLGQPLSMRDDFEESLLDDEVDSEGEERGKKRRKMLSDPQTGDSETEALHKDPDRPKTKQEVMKEVIAKSKLYKYERQKAKEDDDDLRAELDAGVADIYALLRGNKPQPKTAQPNEIPMNPDRAALLNGMDRDIADREYDTRLRELAFDKRSQPTTRTKTEEEKAEEDAQRLRKLEEQRLRRMKGEESESSETEDELGGDEDFYEEGSETAAHDQGSQLQRELGVEDEDEFILDDELITSGSDLEAMESGESSSEEAEKSDDDDDDDEFTGGLLTEADHGRAEFSTLNAPKVAYSSNNKDLAFTYPCPQNLDELLRITKDASFEDVPTIVQRIRALYHPRLNSENTEKTATFAGILVEYIFYLANNASRPPFRVLELLIRHIHSLAKSYPDQVSEAFREKLRDMQKERPTFLNAGDLIVLTAIGAIYPTSDHFHQVVTPATLTIARYLEHAVPKTIADLVKGSYLCTLCVNYQRLSKRYIPELENYILNTFSILSPSQPRVSFGPYPNHQVPELLRIQQSKSKIDHLRKLKFWDIEPEVGAHENAIKISILNITISLAGLIADLWLEKSAYNEIIAPISKALSHFTQKSNFKPLPSSTQVSPCRSIFNTDNNQQLQDLLTSTLKTINIHITQSLSTRKPLALHNHRPLAIKTSVPKFEESYNPTKHYDLDTQRAEINKLKAEHKKERKGVIREFRKEARAEATIQLQQKKARDEAYEKKYRRLVAEIQGEEGREKKMYEREKAGRKRMA
jgi:nucleolar protein 14